MAVTSRHEFTLADRYLRENETVYLTGIQALVRMLLDRVRTDRRAGRDIATLVSGYEGSPLAGYDLELLRQRTLLDEHGIVFQPGLNEELAATAVSGTQLARSVGELRHDGVTGIWYGKAPGLDRATDALRHANLIGTDALGGAVALVGDDPAAKSSSVPCSSEFGLADLGMPTFAPSDPAEVLVHGLHAVELSRASGLWAALKVSTMVADGACSVELDSSWAAPDLTGLASGLSAYAHRPTAHLLGKSLADLERSFHETRLPVAFEYVRRSGVNQIVGHGPARIGIVAAGATYLAVRQALAALGLPGERLEAAGVRLLKLGVMFPVEPSIVKEFAVGLDAIVVVEDKRSFIEDAVKAILYGVAGAPGVYGKHDFDAGTLFSASGEHDADRIAAGLYRFLGRAGVAGLTEPPRNRERLAVQIAGRTPFFCSGCPHNSSTEVAPGTVVGAGIGCHAMLLLMPGERAGRITGLTQMGGEGAQWAGMSPFVRRRHFVQNIGDGTFAHSGSLAVRAAVAAGANITFKLLRNSAVAMTGGQQPVGEMSLPRLIAVLKAEGVRRVVVTTDAPARARAQLGADVEVRHRDDLLDVQRELAAVEGVTVLVHDQECAAERRRKRRRGKADPHAYRVMINERVCEGCGDCGKKSNCLSVQPVETVFGRKTRINQSSCNLDFSCLAGDCPSFLTVVPGRKAAGKIPEVVPPGEPGRRVPVDRFTMRITGIGGTGVVTVSQVLATAAAIEGRFVRTLDQTGLAQKGGAVVSDVIVTRDREERSPKLGAGECDLYLGCDELVAADPVNLGVAGSDRTIAVVSTAEVPTGEMVVDPRASFPNRNRIMSALHGSVRDGAFLDAAALAGQELGDEQYANMILVGAAYQSGALPMSAESVERAIELNGTAIAANLAAFRIGRLAIADGSAPPNAETPSGGAEDVDAVFARCYDELIAYQDHRYAAKYAAVVAKTRHREAQVVAGSRLATAVAGNLYKLMAYKDEYEVARLSVDPTLSVEVAERFGYAARFRYRLHPPLLRALGMKRKISLGSWFRVVFRLLKALRGLRGTPFDPFGRARVRRVERFLIADYIALVDRLLGGLTADNHALAVQIAELPDLVRGYEEIKLRSVAAYRDRMAQLLADYSAADDFADRSRAGPDEHADRTAGPALRYLP